MTFDVVVIGLGGVGSATLLELARRGLRVVGIDQFAPPHALGSSHGETRVIRTAYFEHENYVPLARVATARWRELAEECGEELYRETGVLEAGPRTGPVIQGLERARAMHALELEDWTPEDVRKRTPQFRLPEDYGVIYEARAGTLFVERCIGAQLARAQGLGAEVRQDTLVVGYREDDNGVVVETNRDRVHAGAAVWTVGAWAKSLVPGLSDHLHLTRQPMFWLACDPDMWNAGPAYAFDTPAGIFYGFPSFDGVSAKMAEHTNGAALTSPAEIDRTRATENEQRLFDFADDFLAGTRPTTTNHTVCMYTMSRDGHFIVDRVPNSNNSVFAAGLSGHGFKFAPVLGQALSDLATSRRTEQPIDFLSLGRDTLAAPGA